MTHGETTKAAILDAGLAIMRADPAGLSVRAVGRALGIAHQGILYHFGSADGLRSALASYAVAKADTVIVPRLIVERHPAAGGLSDGERAAYLAGC